MSISTILKPNTLDVYLNEIHGDPVNIDGSLTINNIPVIPGDSQITQTNLGSGTIILADPGTDNSFSFKSLTAGSNVTLTPTSDNISIASSTTVTVGNSGGGQSFIQNPGTGTNFNFKSLVSGDGITVSQLGTANLVVSLNTRNGFSVAIPATITNPALSYKFITYETAGVLGSYNTGPIIDLTTGLITSAVNNVRYMVMAEVLYENPNASAINPDTVTFSFETTSGLTYLSTTKVDTTGVANTYILSGIVNISNLLVYRFSLTHTATGLSDITIFGGTSETSTKFSLIQFP